MEVHEESDLLIQEIKRRARLFAFDNLSFPSDRDILMIENAMLIGATIDNEVRTEILSEEKADEGSPSP
jgi:hypothetical protein